MGAFSSGRVLWMLRMAAAHSFWPGAASVHTSTRRLMASVSARAAAASWLRALGRVSSWLTDLAVPSSLDELTVTDFIEDTIRDWFSWSCSQKDE